MWISQLPSGRWRGGFRLSNGRKVQKTFDYAYEAESWALDAEARARAAGDAPAGTTGTEPATGPATGTPTAAPPKSNAPTVRVHGKHWLARRAGLLANRTVDWYRGQLDGIGETPIASVQVDQLRRSDIEGWMTEQVNAGVKRPTINARLKVLRMVLRDAHAEGLAERNPTDGLNYLPTDIAPAVVVSRVEEARLLEAAEAKPDLHAMILLALDAGLRWEEAAAVGVDCFLGEYLVVRQVIERDARTVRQYPKGKKARNVPMTDRLIAALKPLRDQARATRGEHGLLFVSGEGRPIDYWNWRRDHYRPALRTAKLKPRPRFHDLRHTYGSRLAASGVPRSEIAELLGHADEATTARYIHAGVDGHRRDLVRRALQIPA